MSGNKETQKWFSRIRTFLDVLQIYIEVGSKIKVDGKYVGNGMTR